MDRINEKLKELIRRFGGEKLHKLILFFLRLFGLRNSFVLFSFQRAKKNKVNLNYWFGEKNIGDAISPVIVKHVADRYKVDMDATIEKTKHLYATGSIITAGCQDCTIWGSGVLRIEALYRLKHRKLDVRLVRGPITRLILEGYGFEVPKVYGDPSILMPLIYNPTVEKKYQYGIVLHMTDAKPENIEGEHLIDVQTDDYQSFVQDIKQCEAIISSSLHGIILAEAYGVPAILLKPHVDMVKYYDYYYSTARYEFPIAESIGHAKVLTPARIPDFSRMQKNIIDTFPLDLWKNA